MQEAPPKKSDKGRLYIVATPIGNLEDFTFRGLRILKECAAIACEDTRQTLKLLNKYGLKKKLISYFHPKENQKVPEILKILESGKDVALVSDSGTPGISDPGFPLIRESLQAGISVIPVPGPSAVTAALSASGLPTHRFLFIGFPPPKISGQKKLLESLREEKSTIVFYLPARKIKPFLEEIHKTLGDRKAVIGREISKVYEEFLRGTVKGLIQEILSRHLKGEITLLIEGLK